MQTALPHQKDSHDHIPTRHKYIFGWDGGATASITKSCNAGYGEWRVWRVQRNTSLSREQMALTSVCSVGARKTVQTRAMLFGSFLWTRRWMHCQVYRSSLWCNALDCLIMRLVERAWRWRRRIFHRTMWFESTNRRMARRFLRTKKGVAVGCGKWCRLSPFYWECFVCALWLIWCTPRTFNRALCGGYGLCIGIS